jgi:hypothetical protein
MDQPETLDALFREAVSAIDSGNATELENFWPRIPNWFATASIHPGLAARPGWEPGCACARTTQATRPIRPSAAPRLRANNRVG